MMQGEKEKLLRFRRENEDSERVLSFTVNRQGIESSVWGKGPRHQEAKRLCAIPILKKTKKVLWAKWGPIFEIHQSRIHLLVQKSEVKGSTLRGFGEMSGVETWSKSKLSLSKEVSNLVTGSQGDIMVSGEFHIDGMSPGKWLKCVRFLSSLEIKVYSRNEEQMVHRNLRSVGTGNKKMKCDRRFVGSVWTVRNKDWAAIRRAGLQAFKKFFLEGLRIIGRLFWIPTVQWGPTPFRFENMWLQHPSFKENFRNWWRGFQGMGGKVTTNLDAIEQVGGLTSDLLVQSALRKGELEELILREEIHWRQKVRVKWVKEGDCNSKFFHKVANGRRNRKFIKVLENESGLVLNNAKSIHRRFYFTLKKLYASPTGESWSIEGFRLVPISEESASRLDSPFTEKRFLRPFFSWIG
ncbi:hypothetical protein CK203_034943 [Vitis vinifera]|uniref:Reverse transcriptase zinc-binding domain-containing protein n=1 Tax=Vitis vinifera TaxID=29760 RepID=A0A438FYR8_VITVI|nr:hypothetical protein CK203_034943 [Vitis vinifera]